MDALSLIINSVIVSAVYLANTATSLAIFLILDILRPLILGTLLGSFIRIFAKSKRGITYNRAVVVAIGAGLFLKYSTSYLEEFLARIHVWDQIVGTFFELLFLLALFVLLFSVAGWLAAEKGWKWPLGIWAHIQRLTGSVKAFSVKMRRCMRTN